MSQGSERAIRLVIANPAADDKFGPELSARLLEMNPAASVRFIEDYREEEETGWHYVTKWDLLEWANQELGIASRLAAAK
jgi:hypothetical protein